MSGQAVPHIEFLAEAIVFYGEHTIPPFTDLKARKFSVQLISDGKEQRLLSWKYLKGPGGLLFATLRLKGKNYIVKALPKDWRYGYAMKTSDGCTDWYVWQSTRQLFIGNQFDGPVATTVGIRPAERIPVQMAQQKRTNADEVPIPSKRVRFVVSPNPNKMIPEREPSSTSPCTLPSIILKPQPKVDPLLQLRSYVREKDPLEIRLGKVQSQTADHETVTLQTFLEKIDSTVLPHSGGTQEAAIVEGAVSGTGISKSGAKPKILGRMEICREVPGILEMFLALVEEHR